MKLNEEEFYHDLTPGEEAEIDNAFAKFVKSVKKSMEYDLQGTPWKNIKHIERGKWNVVVYLRNDDDIFGEDTIDLFYVNIDEDGRGLVKSMDGTPIVRSVLKLNKRSVDKEPEFEFNLAKETKIRRFLDRKMEEQEQKEIEALRQRRFGR